MILRATHFLSRLSVLRNYFTATVESVYKQQLLKGKCRERFTEVESRTQGSKPRPRIQKNPRLRPRTALPRTDPLEAKDRNARGQGQEPRTQAQVFSLKKKSPNIFFKRSQKKGLQNIFSGDLQNFTYSKNSAVLKPMTGQLSRT